MGKVEYLISIDSSHGFCKTKNSFINLVGSTSELKIINSEKIQFKSKVYGLSISFKKLDTSDLVIYNINFEFQNYTIEFGSMLKVFRAVLYSSKKINNLECVRNDYSISLCCKLYGKISMVENLMRKLISKFMLETLGVDRSLRYTPKSIDRNKKSDGLNILYLLDFKHLSHLLFQKYSLEPIDKLPSLVESFLEDKKSLDKESENKFEKYYKKSNRDRFFSSIIEEESDQIQKYRRELNAVRNEVAHNRFISKEQYDRGLFLIKYFTETLNKTINNLYKSKPSDDIKQSIIIINKQLRDDIAVEFTNVDPDFNITEIEESLNNYDFKFIDKFLNEKGEDTIPLL